MTMVSGGIKEMILRLDCSKCDRGILKLGGGGGFCGEKWEGVGEMGGGGLDFF